MHSSNDGNDSVRIATQPQSGGVRRTFLKQAGAAAIMSLVHPAVRAAAWVAGSDAPEKKTQHRRWGLLKTDPDYLAVAKQVNRIDVYKDAAAATKTALPKDPMRTAKMIDGVVWDGRDPKRYAGNFKIKMA